MKAFFVALAMTAACNKSIGPMGSANDQLALEDVNFLVQTSATDVAEVERGLPEGATRLGGDELSKQSAREIAAVRRQVLELNGAKTVVFGVANLEGKWLATDAENDPFASNPVGQETERLFDSAKTTRVVGNVLPRIRKGRPEASYVATAAIRDAKGNVNGYFVTTISLSEYAYRLQEALRSHWSDRVRGGAKGSDIVPVFYVVLATPTDLFPAPKVPAVNVEALKTEGVFAKAKANTMSGNLTITDRKFGYAAAMLPKLGDDVAVAVLHSEP